MLKQLHFYFTFLFLSSHLILSQEITQNKRIIKPNIRVKIGISKNSINIRWAVNEPFAWQKTNKIGFVLTRFTISRNGKLLSTPEEKKLGNFLPKPLNDWKNLIEKNDNAAIVTQSLYGENFEVEMNKGKDKLQSIVNQSNQLEQRFAFALMAADLDFEIAKLAGWGYTDTDIKSNEKYLYTVQLNNSIKSLLTIEKGNAIASFSDKTELPKPLDFIGIFQDKTVTLSWEYLQLRDSYTAYFIEKSTNEQAFVPISNLPVVNMNDKEDSQAQGIIYIDSLKQNDQKFSYRIRGKTIFGEYGPYSDIISGSGEKKLEATPRITNFSFETNNNLKVNWEFPAEAEKEIYAFRLIHSETDREGTYKKVKDSIAVNQRSIITQNIAPSNYFKIVAIGKNQEEKESFAFLVQSNDTMPPAIPSDFKGSIDSLGVVRLKWKQNTEKDLEGYHIFRGIQKGDEMVRLTPQAISYAAFKDQIKLESLNNKVYYYVVSTDKRKNQSEPSVILELQKPDRVKPQAPVFEAYKLEENGEITLSWQKSFSSDVASYQLIRQSLDDKEPLPKKIFETIEPKEIYSFTDKLVKPNQRYKYRVVAIDKSQLQSSPSQEITLRSTNQQSADVIKNLIGSANRKKKQIELLWKNQTQDINEIIVYRSKNNEKPSLFSALNGNQNFLEDKTAIEGNTYIYLLKPMLKNNQVSKTEKITVDY